MAESRSEVEWAWERQSVWSQAADQLKASPQRARRWRLYLTVAGAVLALAGSQLADESRTSSIIASVAAAVTMAGVGLLGGLQSIEDVRRWTRARSVAEAIKTEIFLCLTKAGRYAGSEPDRELEAEVQRLQRDAEDLSAYLHGIEPRNRSLPAVHNVESYLTVRVRESQLAGYYEPKASVLRRRMGQFQMVGVALALVAAGLSAVTSVEPAVGAWAAVVTTAVGAVAAYAAAERYETLWVEYSRTAAELRRLVERRTAADGRALTPSELIIECESVISVQNQAWMAKWGEETTPPRPANN